VRQILAPAIDLAQGLAGESCLCELMPPESKGYFMRYAMCIPFKATNGSSAIHTAGMCSE
jgi:hypothetical protein